MMFEDIINDENEYMMPTSNDYFEYYTVKKGDNLYQIAKRYNINPDLLASLNGLNNADYIYPEQMILIPKSGYSYYITKSGDTLDGVADIFNMSLDDMLNQNRVIYLLEGQLLAKKNNNVSRLWYILIFLFTNE